MIFSIYRKHFFGPIFKFQLSKKMDRILNFRKKNYRRVIFSFSFFSFFYMSLHTDVLINVAGFDYSAQSFISQVSCQATEGFFDRTSGIFGFPESGSGRDIISMWCSVCSDSNVECGVKTAIEGALGRNRVECFIFYI